ncbi:MAG: hypothetical protein KME60_03335 [Cyanomargarita calcarea GSE-NOS-MK-12-04C]|jgi:hypothetical protein|uniref:Uncharacterized protein n=1 Tax=Cyanomargarita calcarea GSE-NOS-MK-12-04C TaxID=2839659 RepID=A0A951QHN9_9CYAN|nr:hypothetical protein [Cyanomargarita calcarea GSE-NOS-MK-12-04C]
MGTVVLNTNKLGIAKTTPYYISGQDLLNPEEKDINLRKLEAWQVELKDGANEVSDRLVELIKKHPDIDWYLNNGILSFEEQPAPTIPPTDPPPPVKDIKALSVKLAEPIIKAETDIKLLKEWENDPRTGIKDLVGDRLLELGEMPNV